MLHASRARRADGEPGFARRRLTLTRTERKVWHAFHAGQDIDLRPRSMPGHNGDQAGRRPAVRAEVLIAILCGEAGQSNGARLALRGARITGQLDLSYARVERPITLRDCHLDEPILLTEARLGGLTLDGSCFPALDARNLEVDGDLGLRHASCTRTVDFTGGRLHRDVRLEGAHVGQGESGGVSLAADHVIVEGSVDCHGGFEAAGTVSMTGARLHGTLRLDDAKIVCAGKQAVAFNGDGMTVGHHLNGQRLSTTGEVRLVDVSIASTLELRGARLVNPDGVALRLDRAEISSSLYCDYGFTTIGEVCAIGAHVRGTVYFNNAEIGVPGPAHDGGNPHRTATALRLVRTRIDGDLGCWTEFVAHGTIDMARLSVAGEFRLLTTGLEGYPAAADLTTGRFGMLAISGLPPAGRLDLAKARADFFRDDPGHWRNGDIILDEFEYTSIQMTGITLKQREEWLRRAMAASQRKPGGDHDGYLPQPYEQLAEAYRRAGDDHAARRIQLAKYRQRNHVTKWRRWYSKLWNIVQDGMIGYGYAPLRALIWLIGLFALGTILFRYGAKPHSITPLHRSFTFSDSVSYTLDLLLPTSGLQERQIWQSANGLGEVSAATLVVFGWTLGATVFAAAARVLQRS
jgi:hypothetical protein